MFAKRMRWFVILMIALALTITARLIDVQIVRAEQYETLADNLLTRPVRYLSAPRGGILDRNGRVLVSDEPASDISVRYEILLTLLSDAMPAASRRYLRAAARTLRKRGRYPPDMPLTEIVSLIETRLDELWSGLTDLTGLTRPELTECAARIRDRVERIKFVVRRRSENVLEIAEEHAYHAICADVEADTALTARIELEPDHPWLRVVPSSVRVARDAEPLVHVLGRVGSAGTRRIEDDPLGDDDLRGLRAGDRLGVSGVERLAEMTLRGVKGKIVEDFDRTILARTEPVLGADVRLTIDADLQQRIYDLLGTTVGESLGTENPYGGAAAVVLDTHTREVLALVSYPAFRYEDYWRNYAAMARDNRWRPMRFRAVAEIYPPGSTCKIIALYGGLAEGVVDPRTSIECTGLFRRNMPDSFRCWIYRQHRVTHGPQIAEDAVRNSCNIYFYTLGDRLGVDRLCGWFYRFGLGRATGTGLIEENSGIVPTTEWIRTSWRRRHEPDPHPADAWNYAIGQGEVSATPLQAANVAATTACGRWAPVKLLLDDAGRPLGGAADAPEVFEERHLSVIRKGMWRVVNERGGTAYGARLDSDDYVMCGKTGSAQTSWRVINTKYVLEWPDGRRATVVASSRSNKRKLYGSA